MKTRAAVAPILALPALIAALPARVFGADAGALTRIVSARTASEQHRWAEAIPLLLELTAQSPTNGVFRSMLARSRFEIKDYAGAAKDYEQSLALNAGDPAILAFQIAKCRASLGQSSEALLWLKRSMDGGYRYLEDARTDAAFKRIIADPRVRALLGLLDRTRTSRNEGWRADINFLADWIRKKSFHPFKTETGDRMLSGAIHTRAEFEGQIAKLIRDVPKLSDRRIELELMTLLASLGDGHTALWGSNKPEFGLTLPLGFYMFDDGLRIISAAPKYRGLIGVKVLALDNTPTAVALAKIDPLISRDNTMWLKALEPHQLRHLPFLHELGITRRDSAVSLALELADGTRSTAVIEADTSMPDIWNKLPKPEGWVWIADRSTSEFQQRNDEPYWWTWHADTGILYVQYNRVVDGAKLSLAAFAQNLGQAIADHPVQKLVIDMRNNNGGDTFLNEPLLRVVAGSGKVNTQGHLYVIIGRRVFSAAMNAVSYFGRFTKAVFVGEPTGGRPNSPGDETPFTLPYSGIELNLSDRYWQGTWPYDFSDWRAPDIAVPVTFVDYAAGRDAAMALIEAQPIP